MSNSDAVATVASKVGLLSPPLSAKILESTRSELRGLRFHNPIGTFGRSDNDHKRAAALLEYVAREQEGIKLPMEKLARGAFMKEKDFVKFHRNVGNFRSKTENSSLSSKQPAASSTTTSSAAAAVTTRSSIPSLAMKLGSYLTDSNGVAIRAQRLLNQIVRFNRNNPDQIRDISRNSSTYEAVCFYVVATQDVSPAGSTTASSRRKDDEGEEGKQLQVATVVDVSTDFTLSFFAEILEHVQSMIENMKEKAIEETEARAEIDKKGRSKKRKAGTNNKGGSTVLDDSSSSVAAECSLSTKRSTKTSRSTAHMQDLLEQVQERAKFMESLNDDPFENLPSQEDPRRSDPISLYSPKFLEWKRQVLAEATQSATTALQKDANGDDDNSDQAVTVTREQALEHAARNILASFGLLQAQS